MSERDGECRVFLLIFYKIPSCSCFYSFLFLLFYSNQLGDIFVTSTESFVSCECRQKNLDSQQVSIVLGCLNPIIILALQAELTPEQASCFHFYFGLTSSRSHAHWA